MLKLFASLFAAYFITAEASSTYLPSGFRVEVVQEYESALPGGEKRSSEGHILYSYPGQIRFELKTPDHIVFVSDGESTWYYTAPAIEGQPGELNISEAGNSGLSRFFDALTHGLNSNESYQVEKNDKRATLVFEESMAQQLDIRSAILEFSDNEKRFQHITQVSLTYLDGHQTDLKFKNMRPLGQIDDVKRRDFFRFVPPENTRVNRI